MTTGPSRPPEGGEPFLLVQKIKRDPAVYRTDVPLIVHERCRTPGPCHDGTTPEPPKLLALWLALRWLIAAFPERRGFNQLQVSKRAGIDQKSVQKWARKLVELGLFVEVGQIEFKHLKGKNDLPKVQRIYSIPLEELEQESLRRVGEIWREWERLLFEGEPTPPPPDELQLTLDLSDPWTDQRSDPARDQGSHPSTDQSNLSHPPTDQSAHASTDQTDPYTDEASNPYTDEASDPSRDHMEGGREGEREGQDVLTHEGPNRRPPPTPPAGQVALDAHPLDLWAMVVPPPRPLIERHLINQLAAEHDEPTGGHGWYWFGRALLTVRMSGEEKGDWFGAVRATLRRWRDTDSYGSDAPRVPRLPRVRVVGATSSTPPQLAGEKISQYTKPILDHRGLTGAQRSYWLGTIRNAGSAERPAIFARFQKEHPYDHDDGSAPEPPG